MKKYLSLFMAFGLILGQDVAFAQSFEVSMTEMQSVQPEADLAKQVQSNLDEEKLEEAILNTKKVISVPTAYSEFTFNKISEADNTTTWSLQWRDKDNSNYINASIDEAGNLISYNKSDSNEYSGLGKIDRERAITIAKDFMTKAMPELHGELVLKEASASKANTIRVVFSLYQNKLPVASAFAFAEVNKYTGEITYYQGINGEILRLEYPTADNTISKETAMQQYLAQLGLELGYHGTYQYDKRKIEIFPSYTAKEPSGQYVIDAVTGEKVAVYEENFVGMRSQNEKATMDAAGAGAGSSSDFTPEEKAKLQELHNLIPLEQADTIAKQLVPGLQAGESLTSSALQTVWYEESQYVWRLSYEACSVEIEANTGELVSFYSYQNEETNGSTISEGQAKAEAETFLQKVAPEQWQQSRYKANRPEIMPLRSPVKVEPYSYSFTYCRMVKDNIEAPFDDNYLTVEVNAKTGIIQRYQRQWYKNVVFPSLATVISPEQALLSMDQQVPFEMEYVLVDKDKMAVAYCFNENLYLHVDPFTGARLNSQGEPYEVREILPNYTDIAGHWSESIISALLENGYYLPGNEFQPDAAITQAGFLNYLYSADSYAQADLYPDLLRQGILLEGEQKPEEALTRQDAAKYISRYLGFGELGKKEEIFKNSFIDQIETGYLGYVAICQSYQIFQGDAENKFNGSKQMTNAEAAQAIYQLLHVKQ